MDGSAEPEEGRGAEGQHLRPFFRFHLTTLLLLCPLGSLLIWLNLASRLHPDWPGKESIVTGFPFGASSSDPQGFVIANVFACVAIFLNFGILIEWFDRRNGGMSIRAMLRAVWLAWLLPGILLGVYLSNVESTRSSTFVSWGRPFPIVIFENRGTGWCDYIGPISILLNPLAIWVAGSILFSVLGVALRGILRMYRW